MLPDDIKLVVLLISGSSLVVVMLFFENTEPLWVINFLGVKF